MEDRVPFCVLCTSAKRYRNVFFVTQTLQIKEKSVTLCS